MPMAQAAAVAALTESRPIGLGPAKYLTDNPHFEFGRWLSDLAIVRARGRLQVPYLAV